MPDNDNDDTTMDGGGAAPSEDQVDASMLKILTNSVVTLAKYITGLAVVALAIAAAIAMNASGLSVMGIFSISTEDVEEVVADDTAQPARTKGKAKGKAKGKGKALDLDPEPLAPSWIE